MRIFKIEGKLAEEISLVKNGTVVFYKLLHDEDKDICPHCQKPIDVVHDIVEDSPNWFECVTSVETV